MRVAIATNDGINISERAAMSKYFYIYENGELKEKIENPYANLNRGRGRAVAYLLLKKNIDMFVAGSVGENLKEFLIIQNIEVKEIKGSIKEVLSLL